MSENPYQSPKHSDPPQQGDSTEPIPWWKAKVPDRDVMAIILFIWVLFAILWGLML